MQIKCVAIDDEPLALQLLKGYISRIPALDLVETFDDAISGAEYLRHAAVDLLFLDINMPDITGLDLVKSLDQRPMIIFTTAYKKFAVDGFDLDAIDYLVKPFDLQRFTKAVDKAANYLKYRNAVATEEPGSLVVRSEYKLIKINLSQIEYIESVEDYCKIFITGEKPVLTLIPLKSILERLPGDKFKRIHRSYIVPLAKVKSVLNRRVQLASRQLPISDSYTGFIDEWLQR